MPNTIDRGVLVAVFGPNLQDQTDGCFVVHRPGCASAVQLARLEGAAWQIRVANRAAVALAVYDSQIETGEMTIEEAEGDIHFAPCLSHLPA